MIPAVTASEEREAEQLLEQLRHSAYQRRDTALRLAKLGARRASAARDELMHLMATDWAHDPARDLRLGTGDKDGAFQRLYTARALAALGSLGEEYAQDAAQALRSVIDLYPGWVAVQAARELGALGEDFQPEAAQALWEEAGPAAGQYYGGTDVNLEAACAFATWGPGWAPESAKALRRLAGERSCYRVRARAALALAGLGHEHQQEALTLLLDAVATAGFAESRRIREAAQAALSVSPQAAGRVAEILRGHLAEPDPDGLTHPHAALALADLGPEHADVALPALREALAGPADGPALRAELARRAAELTAG